MALETLLALLFTVFAVPGACLCVLIGTLIRHAYRNWRFKRSIKLEYRNWIEVRGVRINEHV
jgi:hypothetical protein